LQLPQPVPRHERRATVRFASNIESSCEAIGARRGEYWPATIADVSPGGMRLLAPRRFEPGTPVLVELAATEQGLVRSLLARVVYAKPVNAQHWVLGCAFAQKLSNDEVQALL
jgi:hypothetical protein